MTASKTIRVRVGPTLQKAVGQAFVRLEVALGLNSEGLRAALAERYPELAPLLLTTLVVAGGRVLGAAELVADDEVALLHPVAGG